MRYEKERRELVDMCRHLYDRQLVTACDGNVSCMVEQELILITPSGKNKGFLKAEELLLVDLDGNVAEGEGRPSKEFPLHQMIYRTRKEIKAVVHTHPVYATAFALAGKTIPDDYLVESRVMLGPCGLAPYAEPGSLELANAVEPFVWKCDAVLMSNHGAITYGKNLMAACDKMEVLESIAKTIIMSSLAGPAVPIPGF